jgi:hypothetical protein
MESTLQLSNVDLIFTYMLTGEKGPSAKATSFIQNDILSPALDDAVVRFAFNYLYHIQSG